MASPLSVVFCGTSDFAVPSLERLAADPAYRVLLVVTQPDRPVGRSQELTPPAVKRSAERLGLPVFQPEKINTELATLQERAGTRPDFLVVVSFGQLLSQEVLDFPSRSPVNVHASLLPRWRGASPIQQAILAGDHESGVTVQRMVRQLDAGPILSQARTPIDPRETAESLHDRLAAMGADLVAATLKEQLAPQDQDESEITFCRKLSRSDGRADPENETAAEIDRKVRALTPWPGVTVLVAGQELKVLKTSLEPHAQAYGLDCNGNSRIYLVTVQPPGKRPMGGAEWGRGLRV